MRPGRPGARLRACCCTAPSGRRADIRRENSGRKYGRVITHPLVDAANGSPDAELARPIVRSRQSLQRACPEARGDEGPDRQPATSKPSKPLNGNGLAVRGSSPHWADSGQASCMPLVPYGPALGVHRRGTSFAAATAAGLDR